MLLRDANPRELNARTLSAYYFTAVFSLIFAIVGFSYNAWRLEVTEDNSNIRTASFEVLTLLSELEQNMFSSHYDNDLVNGSPRIGWIKVGLIVDLTPLIDEETEEQALKLNQIWAENWENVRENEPALKEISIEVDKTRVLIKEKLKVLR